MKNRTFLTVALFALLSPMLSAQQATIARLSGAETVTVILPSDEEVSLGVGAEVPVGSWVEVPAGSKLFLRTFQGTVSVFSAGSIFEVTQVETVEEKETTRLTLQSGDMVANLDPNKRDVNDYGVVTPKGVAAARGTNYTVSVNGQDVVVTVVAGEVTINIPDVGLVNLATGQVTTGTGGPVSIGSVLVGDNTAAAAAVRNALQAASAAVSTLASTGTDGVTAATLAAVIGVVADVANETGDDSVLTQSTAAAVSASPANAQSVVRAAVARRPSAAQSVVAAATQAVMGSAASGTVDINDVARELSQAANESISTEGDSPVAPVDAGEVVEDVGAGIEDTPEIEVPTDNDANPVSVTFTIRLSEGRFVTVTLNDQDNSAIVVNSPVVVGAQTTQVGDGARVVFDVPASVIAQLGNLTPEQRTNIDAGITQVLGQLPVIEVPNNTIIISPSS